LLTSKAENHETTEPFFGRLRDCRMMRCSVDNSPVEVYDAAPVLGMVRDQRVGSETLNRLCAEFCYFVLGKKLHLTDQFGAIFWISSQIAQTHRHTKTHVTHATSLRSPPLHTTIDHVQ
jgi:hypothetical protein